MKRLEQYPASPGDVRPHDDIEWWGTILFVCPSTECDGTFVIGTQPRTGVCPQCREYALRRTEYVPRRFLRDDLEPAQSPGIRTPSREEIEAGRSPGGGWTRAQLAEWGISWPPPKGWKRQLERDADEETARRTRERRRA